MSLFSLKLNKGFTLVETLVAISILSLSVAATFSAVQNGIQSSILSRDQITAFYLAQEGLEFVKNIRDENALKNVSGTSTNWLTYLVINTDGSSGPCDFGKTCTIDSLQKKVTECPLGGFNMCPNLNIYTPDLIYSQNTGQSYAPTNFKRALEFESISANEVLLTIWVSWISNGVNMSAQFTELLFNQQ